MEFTITDVPEDSLPRDTVPETVDVEYPCRNCGREAGPYRGRGRKPTMCPDCKPKARTNGAPRVTGSTANLAAQASEVLSQLNSFIALGAASVGLFGTSGAIGGYDETFKSQAYAALVTDPDLARFILKGGVKSAKVTLLLAYGGMAVAVAPTAIMEVKEKQAERQARKDAEGVEN